MCKKLGKKHSFETLHSAFKAKLLQSVREDQMTRKQAQTLVNAIKPEDTPGNTCKLMSVLHTFPFGHAVNEATHGTTVASSPAAVKVLAKMNFYNRAGA